MNNDKNGWWDTEEELQQSGVEQNSTETPLLYPDFMRGMCNAPCDSTKCKVCGGNGLKPVMCCGGHECGCMGMPIDFVDCECGHARPTDDQIRAWV